MHIYKSASASLRIDPENLDHHLYNNNGTWWAHYTTYPNEATANRIRRSLETAAIAVARKRRNLLFETLFPSTKRSKLQVFFFPTKAQIVRIKEGTLRRCEQPKETLIEHYNAIAREGLHASEAQWIKLLSLRLALRHHFNDPVIHFDNGLLKVPCLLDLKKDGTLMKFFYKETVKPHER